MNVDFALKVRQRILSQYQSLWMDLFLSELTEAEKKAKEKYGALPPRSPLACGTVGCIAGHCSMEAHRGMSMQQLMKIDPEHEAPGLLGLNRAEANRLFYFFMCEPGTPYHHLKVMLDKQIAGTLGYAQVCAAALDLCIERNRDLDPDEQEGYDPYSDDEDDELLDYDEDED